MRAAALLTSCLAGCASGPWISAEDLEVVRQEQDVDCGAAALASLFAHWGMSTSLAEMREACGTGPEGTSAGTLREVLRTRGFEAYLIRATREDLEHELGGGRPVLVGIVREGFSHYVLVAGLRGSRVRIVDPAAGPVERRWTAFERDWAAAAHLALVVSRP